MTLPRSPCPNPARPSDGGPEGSRRPSSPGARPAGLSARIARALACAIALLLAGLAPALAVDRIETAVQAPERAFGHAIGDRLVQRLLLQHDGQPLALRSLPPRQRVGLWLERQDARVERDPDGREWLRLEYQLVNAPRQLVAAALPGLSLPLRDGRLLQAPAWAFSVGPLTPAQAFGQGELQALRPDRAPVTPASGPAARHFGLALGLLALWTLAWAGVWFWRTRIVARRLPFERAWRQLRRFGRERVHEHPDAWVALHHALNLTAGRTVHAATLHELLERRPHLRPMQARIADFYAASGHRFFAQSGHAEPYPLLDLCEALRRAERQAG